MGMHSDGLRLLLIDDSEDDAQLVLHALRSGGFDVFYERVDALESMQAALDRGGWNLVISDYTMPKFSGLGALEVFRKGGVDIPFILVSGSVGEERAVEAMRNGANDYIMKDKLIRLVPAIRRELKEAQGRRDRREMDLQLKKTEDHLARLKRFFSPQIAELAASGALNNPFQWHRKDVTVLFIDLHGFTSFVETSEPEVVLRILQQYYAQVGKVVQQYGATVGHVAGDGIMIFLNDPVETPNPEEKGVLMALEIREMLGQLTQRWDLLEYPLGFGAGLASGFATIGGVGADGCWDYSIFGTVTNTASRLCSQAKDGQILVSKRFLSTLNDAFAVEAVGDLALKGLNRAVAAYNVTGRNA
jgi:adenylate cyclase